MSDSPVRFPDEAVEKIKRLVERRGVSARGERPPTEQADTSDSQTRTRETDAFDGWTSTGEADTLDGRASTGEADTFDGNPPTGETDASAVGGATDSGRVGTDESPSVGSRERAVGHQPGERPTDPHVVVVGEPVGVTAETGDPVVDDAYQVTRTTNGDELLGLVREGGVDCIVAAQRLPSTTGLDLLRRVRAVDSDLPFLLVPEAGSEAVASEAISAGVTDYLPRDDPATTRERDTESGERTDGTESTGARTNGTETTGARTNGTETTGDGERAYRAKLAARIDESVREYHAARRRRRSRERLDRLGDLFEFAVDAAGLYMWDWDLTTDTVERYPSAAELFGLDSEELEPVFDGFLSRVDPAHREEVETTLQTAIADASSYRVRYALTCGDGSRAWIEERGSVLTDDTGTPRRVTGLNVVITDRKQRERELEWERDLNRTLHEALVESETRAGLETTIVEQLREFGFPLVWIGDAVANEIDPAAVAGPREYVDAVDLQTDADQRESDTDEVGRDVEPAVAAVRSGSTQFVDDVGEGRPEPWIGHARRHGFETVAALPLVYNSVCYGVLAVYDGEAAAFDQTARRLLSELADTLAFVVHNIESKNALAADRRIHATIQLHTSDYYLREVLQRADCDIRDTRLLVHETLQQDAETYIQYVSVNGTATETVVETARDHAVVEDVTVIGTEENPRLQITHHAETPEVVLADVGARVKSTSVTARRTDLLVVVANNSVLKMAIDALEEANGSVSLLSSIERDRAKAADSDPLSGLTDRQSTVLRAAYHRGYFERPRESSAKDVAGSLDISHPTLLEHLRLAQEKVFRHHFE
jgi:PAS domain S-box-containing protein